MTEGTPEERELFELMAACAPQCNANLYALGLERDEVDPDKHKLADMLENPYEPIAEQCKRGQSLPKLLRLELVSKALDLRSRDKTYREIGERLGVSLQTAYELVRDGKRFVSELEPEPCPA